MASYETNKFYTMQDVFNLQFLAWNSVKSKNLKKMSGSTLGEYQRAHISQANTWWTFPKYVMCSVSAKSSGHDFHIWTLQSAPFIGVSQFGGRTNKHSRRFSTATASHTDGAVNVHIEPFQIRLAQRAFKLCDSLQFCQGCCLYRLKTLLSMRPYRSSRLKCLFHG